MKKIKYLFFVPFLVILAGCFKTDTPTVTVAPVGLFNGIFSKIRYNSTKKGYDTSRAALSVNIDLTTGYSVSGDTTVLHTHSYGDFATSATIIQFADYNYRAQLQKVHLNGAYTYTYDGLNLQMLQTYADTLKYLYVLRKQ